MTQLLKHTWERGMEQESKKPHSILNFSIDARAHRYASRALGASQAAILDSWCLGCLLYTQLSLEEFSRLALWVCSSLSWTYSLAAYCLPKRTLTNLAIVISWLAVSCLICLCDSVSTSVKWVMVRLTLAVWIKCSDLLLAPVNEDIFSY